VGLTRFSMTTTEAQRMFEPLLDPDQFDVGHARARRSCGRRRTARAG
jgi:hypothetical protein